MPFLIYPLAAAVLGAAYFASTEEGKSFIEETKQGIKTAGQELMIGGVVVTGLSVLPLTNKQKITIGAAYSAYLIAKIKADKKDQSVLEKGHPVIEEVELDETWLF
jgi:hypothetical protein